MRKKNKPINTDWKGSEKWLRDTQRELTAKADRREQAVADFLRGRGVLVERYVPLESRWFIPLYLPDLRVAIDILRERNPDKQRLRDAALERSRLRVIRLRPDQLLDLHSIVMRICPPGQ